MSWAERGNNTQVALVSATNVDSATVAFPANVASGSLLVAVGASWQSGSGNTSVAVSDTLTTTYTTTLATTGTGWSGGVGKPFIARGIAGSAGANTVTIDPSSTGNYFNAAIDEFTGPHATPLDVDDGETTGSSTAPSASLTTLTACDLLIGVLAFATSGTISLDGGARMQLDADPTGTEQPYAAAFRYLYDTGVETMSWTLGTSRDWSVLLQAFKPAAGVGGGSGGVGRARIQAGM